MWGEGLRREERGGGGEKKSKEDNKHNWQMPSIYCEILKG